MSRLRKAFIVGILVFFVAMIASSLVWPRTWRSVDRDALGPDGDRVFGLILSLQHFPDGADLPTAERICHWLLWQRCDRPALEELERRTQPGDYRSKDAQTAAALAVADAIWALGTEDDVRKMFRFELNRIPQSDGPARARVFLRSGIIDTSPDGQAALFAQACAADASLCARDQMKVAAVRELRARLVPPGNALPLYFGSGRPPIAGQQ